MNRSMCWRSIGFGYLCGRVLLIVGVTLPVLGQWRVLTVRGDTVDLIPPEREHVLVLTHPPYACMACYRRLSDSLESWLHAVGGTLTGLPVVIVSSDTGKGGAVVRRTVARRLRTVCSIAEQVYFAFQGGQLPKVIQDALAREDFIIAYCRRQQCSWSARYEQLEHSDEVREQLLKQLWQHVKQKGQ